MFLSSIRRAGSRVINSRIAKTHVASQNIDVQLRNDVKLLGKTLGVTIKEHNPKVYQTVEELRTLGREWRLRNRKEDALSDMVAKVKSCDGETLHGVSKSFANFLALANSAENHHRMRRLRSSLLSENCEFGLWPKIESCGGGIQDLINNKNIPTSDVFNALKKQSVEIVLTAHPTEVNRRTMIRKLQSINAQLSHLDNPALTNYEKKEISSKLRGEISAIWGSDFLRRSKPSPVEEAKSGLAVVENTLWTAVPSFVRKLDDISRKVLHEPLPLQIAPIKMASWMGGDRDGNPNVTPEVTLEVSMLSRWMAATLFLVDIAELKSQLSIQHATQELFQLPEISKGAREPYRELLKHMEGRLNATIAWTEEHLPHRPNSPVAAARASAAGSYTGAGAGSYSAAPYCSSDELLNPLLMMHKSLTASGLHELAGGALTDSIRRVSAFGLSLLPIDIRQESTRHSAALDSITKHLGVGAYMEWDEAQRRDWLLRELCSKRKLQVLPVKYSKEGNRINTAPNNAADDIIDPALFSSAVVDTLRTFEVVSVLGEGSIGAYVISQCQQASDILAVMLLQQYAGVEPTLRVVPLFETLDDLQRSKATVEALFEMEKYRELIKGKQEIMVGYSDSAKDAGRLAASWAQYNAQVDMAAVAAEHKIELTFFHGKGGTVGRGGNPALHEAILAHPPGTVQGRFRVTEQGEMITQNLGEVSVAERTLDLFTAGVLAEGFTPRPTVRPEWAACMERMSTVSCDAYRKVVRGEPRFVPYFRAATPELELAGLNVGSRPAKRNPKGGVESLRAIPWVFAWTQTRLNLPTWLGVGEALRGELEGDPAVVKDMYSNWPWFRTLIDLLEMILVKSDAVIAANYDQQLISDPASIALGKELRGRLAETTAALLEVSGHSALQEQNELLLNSLEVRNPYVDPLNVIQAELLLRLRSADAGNGSEAVLSEQERVVLQDALLITINGIANGMRNSG